MRTAPGDGRKGEYRGNRRLTGEDFGRPEVLVGKPVVKGTRVAVELVLASLGR